MDLKCPFCQSTNLVCVENSQCCEDCGASFEIIQEPQDILLEDALERNKLPSWDKGDDDPETIYDSVMDNPYKPIADSASIMKNLVKERDEFFETIKSTFKRGELKSGTEIEIPYVGIGFELFIQKNYREWGYEDMVIIRCSQMDILDAEENLKGFNSKTLVVLMESERAPRDLAWRVIEKLKETDCTYFSANYKLQNDYYRMRG